MAEAGKDFFYANALDSNDIQAGLARFGVTTENLQQTQALVNDVEKKHNIQLQEKGEAQQATKVRDEAFDTMQEWMSDFVAVARIALEDSPQYLEVLGIVEPS